MNLKRLNNQSGIVMITVIMTVLVLSVIVISYMSINLTQIGQSRKIGDSVTASVLAEGVLQAYSKAKLNGDPPVMNGSEDINNKTFTYVITETADSGPNGTTSVSVQIDYN